MQKIHVFKVFLEKKNVIYLFMMKKCIIFALKLIKNNV